MVTLSNQSKMLIIKLFVPLVSMLGIARSADWCYKSQVSSGSNCKGPDKWKDIAPTCGSNKQSPINIVTKKVAITYLSPLIFQGYENYFHCIITNNGHTVKVHLLGDAVIEGAGLQEKYKAMEIHFHWGKNGGPGSEHTIDGKQYPMEMHIVHIKSNYSSVLEASKDASGIAVLGFLYQESDRANKNYESIINALPNIIIPGNNTIPEPMNLKWLIPSQDTLARYFHYNGSLTTPDCAESVIWTVFESRIALSKEQLSAFSALQFEKGTAMTDTFRPVQPLNDRDILYSASNTASVGTVLTVSTLFVVFFAC